jgi:beta-phosphoglucomutase-like phosphatase (HAD superfamily)
MQVPEAVIFDLDGLVLDTEATYFAAWQMAAAQMGYQLSDEFCFALSGLQYRDIELHLKALFGGGFDLTAFNQLSAQCWHDYVKREGIAVKPGFFSMLEYVHAHEMAFCIASNSQREPALQCLRYAGLDQAFPVLVGRDDVINGKPEADVFYRAAELLNCSLGDSLILEDSITGILASSKTPATSVYIPSILPADEQACSLADYVFESLAELSEYLTNFPRHS